MESLALELVSRGFPFSKARVDFVASALIDDGVTSVAALRGVGHLLPMRRSCAKLPVTEIQWVVNLAVQITKSPLGNIVMSWSVVNGTYVMDPRQESKAKNRHIKCQSIA